MDDNSDKINDLRKYLSNSERLINDLDEEIKNLSAQKTLIEENEKLRQSHKQKQLKITEYKDEVNDLEYQKIINHKTISEIKENKNKPESGSIINEVEDKRAKKIDDFIKEAKKINPNCQIFFSSEINQLNNEIFQENQIYDFEDEGNAFNNENEEDEEIKDKLFNLIKDREEVEQIFKQYGKEQICQIFFKDYKKKEEEEIFKENNNINNNNYNFIEENNIKKMQFQEIYLKLKDICKEYHDDLEHANLVKENYNNFFEELIIQILLILEGNMAKEEVEQITINIDEIENIEFMENEAGKIATYINRLNNLYSDLKENFGLNVEQLLSKLNIYLKSLNKKKYLKNERKQNIIFYEIEENFKQLLNICRVFERKMQVFYIENQRISKEVDIFKNKFFKEKADKKMNNLNELFNFANFNNNNNEDDKLAQSFLIEYKNQKNKNNFDNNNEELMEQYINEPKLIRKNWIEKCYIYDDYDVHDIIYMILFMILKQSVMMIS